MTMVYNQRVQVYKHNFDRKAVHPVGGLANTHQTQPMSYAFIDKRNASAHNEQQTNCDDSKKYAPTVIVT